MHYITMSVLVLRLSAPPGQEVAFDLSEPDCQKETLISIIDDGARVFASCASEGAERIMRIAVSNVAADEKGPLRDFSVGFCGPSVIRASAPTGWVAKIEGDERHSVTWSLPDELVGKLGIRSRSRTTGFVVHLKPGWRRSRSDSAWWGESSIVTQATTHDCP